MARSSGEAYPQGMKRGFVPVWAAVFSTLVSIAYAGALWLGHSQGRDYARVLVLLPIVAWMWWSAIQGLRERRDAKES